MDWWYQADWGKEDELFSPKRKVNNKNSLIHPHIIGSFYSPKMGRVVSYESLAERLFYYYLELDNEVIRYYEQPVEVQISNSEGCSWSHVPDVLFFKQGSIPYLCQIKDSEASVANDTKLQSINRFCELFAKTRGWEYDVIYPKDLPYVYGRNLKYLKRFLRQRSYFAEWESRVIQRVMYLKSCGVRRLAETFDDKIDPLALLPLIYYLIAKGIFSVDFSQEIGPNSLVAINNGQGSLAISIKGEDLLWQ
jgi:hypothetical protein